jgi:NitT/TauT family transport system ATP-binding protein
MKTMLSFEDVSYTYHTEKSETLALNHLSFSIGAGQFVSVIGPSGCGKSTILSLAAGLIQPSAGRIVCESKAFGYMLQKDALFPWRTVEQNLCLPLEVQKRNTPEAREKAIILAKKYGLGEFLKKKPCELSGGMRQRAALIRTLAAEPDLLLLDEPFSALDYQTRLAVCDDVQAIMKNEHKTALLVTHDISEAIALSDVVVVLSARPAHVVATHEICFGDNVPKKRRNSSEFAKTFEVLRAELGL